jgi:hypothetical protein
MRVRKASAITILAATVIGTATQPAVCQYNPSFEWQTSDTALVCPNYFAAKEAKAALHASDPAWLNQLGCSFAVPGLKIALIDAPNTPDNIWHGRIYPSDGRAPFNAYFSPVAAVTYALYGPFRDRADAERETKPLIDQLKVAKNPRSTVSYEMIGQPGAFTARIGPTMWNGMNLFCLKAELRTLEKRQVVPECRVMGKRP